MRNEKKILEINFNSSKQKSFGFDPPLTFLAKIMHCFKFVSQNFNSTSFILPYDLHKKLYYNYFLEAGIGTGHSTGQHWAG